MRIPFIGQSQEARSVAVNAQKTVNWYVEVDQTGKNRISLLPMPGLLLEMTLGVGPHRGSFEHDGDMYVVSGKSFYKIDSNENQTLAGTLNTASGRVAMATNGTYLVVVDGVDGWVWDGTSLDQITDADFVDAQQIIFLDGYFLVNKPSTGEFYISTLYPAKADLVNGAGWTSLNFATAEIDPDNLIALAKNQREAWFFGDHSTEIYYNSGDASFTFAPLGGGFIEWGIAAQWSVANADNTLFWLAKNKQGQGHVVKAQGFNPQVISNPALENTIAGYTRINDAFAFTFQYLGQSFYVLTFPSADATHVYHINSGTWIEWKAYGIGRHRSNSHCFFNGKHYVGDYDNGNLYSLDKDTYTDNGATIERIRRTQHISQENKNIFWHKIEIDFEGGVGLTTGQGSDPQAMLRWSDDRGKTWSNAQWRSMGKIGKYDRRAIWRMMGRSRDRVWELVITDPIKAVVIDAYADIAVGDA